MTKHLFSAVACCAIMSAFPSCQKAVSDLETTTDDEESLVKVSFNVSAFASSTEPFTRAGDNGKPLKDVASRLDFMVFYGNTVAALAHQQASDDGFGTITATLSPGDYTVACVAHNGSGNATVSTATKATFPDNKVTDTFACGGNITVDNQTTEHPLQVQRSVACFRLVTTDNIPSNVAKMKFYYLNGSNTLNPQTNLGSANSKQTVTFDVTSTVGQHGSWDVYTFPKAEGANTMQFQITALDSDGNELYQHNFTSVTMQRNQRTVYTGAFFGGDDANTGDSFTVTTTDADWTDNNQTF